MTVSAQSDTFDADPATSPAFDLRRDPSVRAGTFEWRGPELCTGWHRHPYHQVEYALEGVVEVGTPAGRYLLPPQQAVWIPAGLPHVSTLREVHSVSLFLDPALAPSPDDRARILAAAPVIREMLVHGLRWPIERTGSDPRADAYFEVLASLVLEWLDRELPLHLPTTADPLLAAVAAYVDEHLASASSASVCRAVGLSERTLRRRCGEAFGMPWNVYLVQCRMLRAASMLAATDSSVVDVATAVGFESASSFARAFRRWMGETPSSYRRQMRDDGR